MSRPRSPSPEFRVKPRKDRHNPSALYGPFVRDLRRLREHASRAQRHSVPEAQEALNVAYFTLLNIERMFDYCGEDTGTVWRIGRHTAQTYEAINSVLNQEWLRRVRVARGLEAETPVVLPANVVSLADFRTRRDAAPKVARRYATPEPLDAE